ncbi:MAG TPA: acyl-phosphate glycerol 3-phosphate acyltransferase [Rhodobacteraceae bacterium]|nr:glycerol-3-phosphate 1-O-acyltransferase PlsY [Alphaproteobacteria bacterium]MCH9832290.1 glycerol-3-phosphate 1-O-acyltransferase PlsY [Alphaproteobacteria bacterium]MDA9223428.1 glycerol-3-phosphate 1-O-acyltransferase PlsY [Tateyamaria sp.]HAB36489.1 acyl-phosphate glycerol 3-phosphate acyltransferase [Paracoccaceae bacterium]
MPVIESSFFLLTVWATIGYLLGSIPFGILIAKIMKLGNLREIGSGNIGATNVLRTGNKTAAALTLLLDASKGATAFSVAWAITGAQDATQLASLTAMIGHCYPIWLKFKGGKGVATFLGLMLALNIFVGTACCLAWLVGAGISRISSVGALVAAATSTFFISLFDPTKAIALGMVLTFLVFWRHKENIVRIWAGTEPKIGTKK